MAALQTLELFLCTPQLIFEGFIDSPIFACVLVFTIVIQVIIMETVVAGLKRKKI